jgi:Flp pilus assembly protein TadG
MKRRLLNKFINYFKSEGGNLTLATAVMSFVIVAAIAVAIDTTRMIQAKSILRDANDAATLAAAREFQKTQKQREAIYQQTIHMMLAQSNAVEEYDYEIDFTETKGAVRLNSKARGKAKFFFPNFTMKNMEIEVESQALTGKIKLEVALVLDVSGIDIGTRIKEVQEASQSFVEIILKNSHYKNHASISIIPFAGTVKLPDEMRHFLKAPPTNKHWVDGKWNGCLSLRPNDFKYGLSPRKRYPYMADFISWGQSNTGWCPAEGSELISLTNNFDKLSEDIDNLATGYGSGNDHAMAWAYATLDPKWQGKFPNSDKANPLHFDNRYKKAIIFMANSKTNDQRHPKATELNAPAPVNTNNTAYDEETARRAFLDLCDLAKEKDIEIFTVGFNMTREKGKEELKDCATSDAHYHEAKTKELEETYEEIAAYLSSLRLTR